MKDVDRPADIQPFPQPAWASAPGVDVEASRDVIGSKDVRRIRGDCNRERNVRNESTIRPPKLQRAVGLSLDLEALLVDRAVVTATEQREVRQRGRATLRPVADVMTLAERQAAAREAAATVSMMERSLRNAGGIVRVRAPTSSRRPS
jgi:hypothetical protein